MDLIVLVVVSLLIYFSKSIHRFTIANLLINLRILVYLLSVLVLADSPDNDSNDTTVMPTTVESTTTLPTTLTTVSTSTTSSTTSGAASTRRASTNSTVTPATVDSNSTVTPDTLESNSTFTPATVDSNSTVTPDTLESNSTFTPATVDSDSSSLPHSGIEPTASREFSASAKGVVVVGTVAMIVLVISIALFLRNSSTTPPPISTNEAAASVKRRSTRQPSVKSQKWSKAMGRVSTLRFMPLPSESLSIHSIVSNGWGTVQPAMSNNLIMPDIDFTDSIVLLDPPPMQAARLTSLSFKEDSLTGEQWRGSCTISPAILVEPVSVEQSSESSHTSHKSAGSTGSLATGADSEAPGDGSERRKKKESVGSDWSTLSGNDDRPVGSSYSTCLDSLDPVVQEGSRSPVTLITKFVRQRISTSTDPQAADRDSRDSEATGS